MRRRLGWLLRAVLHTAVVGPLLRVLFGVTVSGRENFGGLGRFVLVANHNSHLDVLLLYCALPRRQVGNTRPVAAADYFGKAGIVRRLLEALLDPVWIEREGAAGRADPVEVMTGVLRGGDNLIIFPEGTRGRPGEMQRFRTGLGRVIAGNPGVAVVPAYISGPEKVMPKGALVPLPLWNSVTVGPPLRGGGGIAEVTAAAEAAVRDLERMESARRHRRAARRARVSRSVAILGIDGSGKSSVSRLLAETASRGSTSAWVSDRLELFENGRPRDLQPLITDEVRKLVGRSAKKAGSLKLYKIPKLAELLLRDRLLGEIERWFAPRLIVLDGSPLLNLAAWSVLYRGDLSEEDCRRAIEALAGDETTPAADPLFRKYPELLSLRRLGLARLRRPDAAVFLDLPPETAVERARKRGAAMQAHETAERLGRLSAAYRVVTGVAERRMGMAVLTIDASGPLDGILPKAEDFIRRVLTRE